MALCDLCGKTLDEEEKEELGDRQVCHDCRYDGMKALKEKIGKLRKIGRDRLESKQRLQQEKDEASDDDADSTDKTDA